MQLVEATCKRRGVRRGLRLWPCTPPLTSPGPRGPPGTPLYTLGAPAPCAWTPLQLVLLNVLDLCLFMPDPRLLDPVSLFLMDERSDAALVGSGNKAMGKSPFLTF